MFKLKYESGHIVIRNPEGFLHWSSHWGDMKGSYEGEPCEGGYKEILLTGELIEKHDYYGEKRISLGGNEELENLCRDLAFELQCLANWREVYDIDCHYDPKPLEKFYKYFSVDKSKES